ncbi:MAG: molybdenum cofactor biosynthesis protein MoaE [Holophaga sp.]|nr:molybdenum cofactor biosynthesis protein MoaE [Holophaga sp.]
MEICSASPIDPAEIYDTIVKNGAGSVLLHYAVVKPATAAGGTTQSIDYCSVGDCEAELRGIAREMFAGFSLEDVILVRRTGRLNLGDIISLVAVSATSSEDAFNACRQGLTRLKAMKSILKDEVFAA